MYKGLTQNKASTEFGWVMKKLGPDRWHMDAITRWHMDAKEIAIKRDAYRTMTLHERINWRVGKA